MADQKSDDPMDSPGQLALGCVFILFLLFMLGRCVFGGSNEPTPTPSPTAAAPAQPTQATSSSSGERVGSTMLEQAIFDAFPTTEPKTKAGRKKASQAADFIGATINSAGHLCAHPVQAMPAATGQYGIMCRKYRAEGGIANYLVDVRSGSVAEI